jgi:uncharacterized repeat protein (TIGR03803 family)
MKSLPVLLVLWSFPRKGVPMCRFCVLRAAVLALLLSLTITAAQAQTYSVLYNFGKKSNDPVQPQPALIVQARDGNLYSTTERGESDSAGTVFKITPNGTVTVLYEADFADGFYPTGGLTLGTDGYLYGAAQSGGSSSWGTVFRISTAGDLMVLHNFANTDGASPYSPPIEATDGNFYGTTLEGGSDNYGTVYQLTPSGVFTTLYSFDHVHGAGPLAPLLQGSDGNFYGTTIGGGTYGDGTVFKITNKGKLTDLLMFDGTNGMNPTTALVEGNDGDFYGTTGMGDTVFKIPNTGKLSVLYRFSASSGLGYDPESGVVLGTDGNFYGVAYQGGVNNGGTIYRITPQGAYSVQHYFDTTHGSGPFATLVQHTNGFLYGDTYSGGADGFGVFYRLSEDAKPFVRFLSPLNSGKVGSVIQILGQGLRSATAVAFNGRSATFSATSATFMTATVPLGAETGFVTVTTSSGTLKSNEPFRVTPQIKSFSPTSGPVGVSVTITGVSLKQTTKVTVNGVPVPSSNVTVKSDTEVIVTVPTGAKTGKIVITTVGGTAESVTNFIVT